MTTPKNNYHKYKMIVSYIARFARCILISSIKNKTNNYFYYPLIISFFTCIIITTIDSIVTGIQKDTLLAMRSFHADIRITLKKNISFQKAKKICADIEKDFAVVAVPLGIHYAMIYFNKTIKPIMLIVSHPSLMHHFFSLEKIVC